MSTHTKPIHPPAWVLAAGAFVAITVVVASAFAETQRSPKSQSVQCGESYDRGTLWRALFGDAWRDVWSAEIDVPVLDLDSFAGGLTPFKADGNQSKTLRFHGADGRTYIFRSTEKHSSRKSLPDDLKRTPVGALVQDQIASLHPTGHLAVAELEEAVGVLHSPPTLVVMPDDPLLGEYREEFAHMLGQIEERPDDEAKGRVFAGAKDIAKPTKLLEKMETSLENRLDSRDYLKARLVDFLVGDTDRGADQWRFAKFERGGIDVYRPIPRDRDYAFMKVDALMGLSRRLEPRLVRYGEQYPGLNSLLHMTEEFDRCQLIDLSWNDWQGVVRDMQRDLNDDVIDRAISRLPKAHREASGERITRGLKARRDGLMRIARDFYLRINREADLFASDEPEQVEIEREPDGSVTVRIASAAPGIRLAASGEPPAAIERRFVPDETREIRVYLERGNDVVVVRGDCTRSIPVRIIGGEGDDSFTDLSRVEHGGATYFYDASGHNEFKESSNTRINVKPFETPPPMNSLDEKENEEQEDDSRTIHEERRGRYRDLMSDTGDLIADTWGSGTRFHDGNRTWMPYGDYQESGGVVLGFGPSITRYGFRHQPHAWKADARAMVGTRNGGLGIMLRTDRHFENSPWGLYAYGHATQLESNRFNGYGNETERVDLSLSLIERDEILVEGGFRYSFRALRGAGSVEFGPVIKYVDPEVPTASPGESVAPLGSTPFGQVGVRAELVHDATEVDAKRQSGFGVNMGASAYPAAWDAEEPFGEEHALARVFIPLGYPTLALRTGARHCWGEFPLHESAFIGGLDTVRGFRWNRFAGDLSAYGAAELRVPIARIVLLTRGQLGAIGFADAGRVWFDGHSDGEWHTGAGGGLWFGSLERQVSFTYARGEEHRVYFYYGMPF